MIRVLALALLLSDRAFAQAALQGAASAPSQQSQSAPQPGQPAPSPPPPAPVAYPTTRGWFNANVTPFSVGLPVVNKAALTFGVNLLAKYLSVEAEYFGGRMKKSVANLELGSLQESIVLARARVWPTGKALNLYAGYGVRWLDATLLATSASIRSNVVEAGLGHRLDLGKLTLGVDWLTAYVPVGDAQVSVDDPLDTLTEKEREDTEDQIRRLKHFPTIALFKLYVGVNF